MDRQFPFRFAGYSEKVTNEMLNSAYGDYGRTFRTEAEAIDYAYRKPNVYITRLINYHDKDVARVESLSGKSWKVKIQEDARPYTIGWLVSHAAEIRKPGYAARA